MARTIDNHDGTLAIIRGLARRHAAEAAAAIDTLPPADEQGAGLDEGRLQTQLKCRRALKELARLAVERMK